MWDIFNNPWFWGIILAISVFAAGVLTTFRRLPVVGMVFTKRNLMIVGLIGLVATTAGFGFLSSTASLNGSSPSGLQVSQLQVTTDFATDALGTIEESSSQLNLIDVRLTDAQANETASVFEVDDGIITVTRTGDLKAASCNVVATTPRGWNSEITPGDGSAYTITEVDTLNRLEVYLKNGGAATTSSPKEMTSLSFAEGSATQTLGVLIEVDEDAHDNLLQYSYRDVTVNVCGKPMVFRIHRMD